jgi:hypothetical protein
VEKKMANPWFRLYSEFVHDPKIQMLSEAMQRRYVMLMCLRCSETLETLHETEIAFQLRIDEQQLNETKQLFISKNFIDENWKLLNWDKRQFVSDSSTMRVARHRNKKKQVSNIDETLQEQPSNAIDTDTDTDTDSDKKQIQISVSKDTGVKPPLTPDEIIFGYGVPLLTNAGATDKSARSFLGSLRKAHGDETLVNTLRDCIRAKPIQPLEWLAKALPPDGIKPKLNKQESLEASNRAVVEKLLKKEGFV